MIKQEWTRKGFVLSFVPSRDLSWGNFVLFSVEHRTNFCHPVFTLFKPYFSPILAHFRPETEASSPKPLELDLRSLPQLVAYLHELCTVWEKFWTMLCCGPLKPLKASREAQRHYHEKVVEKIRERDFFDKLDEKTRARDFLLDSQTAKHIINRVRREEGSFFEKYEHNHDLIKVSVWH